MMLSSFYVSSERFLQERLEAASALKKQMWAEAQLDKRRIREEFTGRYSYSSAMGNKAEACQTNATMEGSPLHGVDNKGSDGNLDILNNDQFVDPHNLCNGNMSAERNLLGPEFSTNTDILAPQPYGYAAEKSRSQLKSYIGHKAEEMYVYRSLPLGQDRRRNRYWLFSTSVSRNDPGSGRIFYESRDGFWKLIDSEEVYIFYAVFISDVPLLQFALACIIVLNETSIMTEFVVHLHGLLYTMAALI